ncbi:S1C family serine protease [Verrucomicrobium sp. BvORR106]|uniref:S1C family serine protease n=1 Tax=Verrucomicrobium sp. BvORR106 TaxID=1403819 RepID=UPI0005700329|nr:S1C family serine protease [Verrucomicrobium sp. BvORR106]
MILALGRSSKEHSQGSGFFIAPGIIVTNRHVVDKGSKLIVIMPDKTEVTAKLVGKSTTIDAAVLKVDRTNHSSLRFARSSSVQIGSQVCAVGYPVSDYLAAASGTADFSKALAGISPTSTYGRIGGRQTLKNTKCLHLDLNLNPGNSGGPVMDRASQVVGVSTYKLMGADGTVQGMNFAIEADLVRQFVEETVPGIRL